jgi:Ran GTPase-activating protein (RanGAP) involved in mRNA processing and transport
MQLTDSDMEIVVSEIIIKRQCSELDLSWNSISYTGILTLAHALQKNKVRRMISSLLFSS